MAEPPDLQNLAKQYLDLWQDQLGGVSKDPQTAEIMAQTMELMNADAHTFATMAAAAQSGGNTGDNDQGDSDGNPPPHDSSGAGARPAGAPSGAADPDLAKLARRLERIEERLDLLEAASRKGRRNLAKKS
jgi:hypothetical protein